MIRAALVVVVFAGLALSAAAPVRACTNCRDAVATPVSESDSASPDKPAVSPGAAAAYNVSIVVMFCMPFAAIGTVAFLCWRSCRKAANNPAHRPAVVGDW